ncbi:hypothetical protein P691DRAFT_801827 [Macrolepiota fuliginosa MF-IS2]|uniref:Uncharacterized protein n=1 Tax=Macrolepiota fuliginosa MF-IS2 TaxID=1400762 RepID=A0A9P5XDX3_9AGAR|nr:hypothetical protein P691DRAFT_801827 [Macrolepiota fuliginosa MF-IS2]
MRPSFIGVVLLVFGCLASGMPIALEPAINKRGPLNFDPVVNPTHSNLVIRQGNFRQSGNPTPDAERRAASPENFNVSDNRTPDSIPRRAA